MVGLSLAWMLGFNLSASHAQEASAEVATPAEVKAHLPHAQWAGSARMRFFTFDIYDAKLWVAQGFSKRDFAKTPFALELTYLRTLAGKAIAERSLKEMQRAGKLPAEQAIGWLAAMEQAFPDVKAGDRLTGLHLPGTGARFFLNGQARASIADADFSRYFFGIWLSPSSSEPQLREQLWARLGP